MRGSTGKHPTRSWMERTSPPIRTTSKAMPGRRTSSPAMGRTPLPPGRRSPPPQTACWTRCSPTRGSRSWRCTTPAAPAPPKRRRMSGRPRCPIWFRWIPPPTGTPRLPRARRSSPRRRCAPPSPPPLTGSSSGRTRRCGSPRSATPTRGMCWTSRSGTRRSPARRCGQRWTCARPAFRWNTTRRAGSSPSARWGTVTGSG